MRLLRYDGIYTLYDKKDYYEKDTWDPSPASWRCLRFSKEGLVAHATLQKTRGETLQQLVDTIKPWFDPHSEKLDKYRITRYEVNFPNIKFTSQNELHGKILHANYEGIIKKDSLELQVFFEFSRYSNKDTYIFYKFTG